MTGSFDPNNANDVSRISFFLSGSETVKYSDFGISKRRLK